jgi:hypothetical protein
MLCPILCPRSVNTIVTCYFCWVCLCLCLGPQLCTGFAAVPWVDSCVLGTVLCPKSCAVPIDCSPEYPCWIICKNNALYPPTSLHYFNFCYQLFVHSFSMSCCTHPLFTVVFNVDCSCTLCLQETVSSVQCCELHTVCPLLCPEKGPCVEFPPLYRDVFRTFTQPFDM